MKKLSKLLATILAVVVFVTAFVGCHEKNEIAFTVGDTEFTSAMFSCTQFFTASSARSAIDTFVKDSGAEVTNINYDNYKFDDEGNVTGTVTGTAYKTFVRNETIKTLRQNAALEALMKEYGIELDQDAIDSYTLDATAFWNYGCDANTYYQYAMSGMDPRSYYTPYAPLLEENGVAYKTFETFRKYDAMYSYLFEKLYATENGKKEIARNDLETFMKEHYVLADYLTFSKKGSDGKELSDEKLKELKAVIEGYAERLNNGEKFETIDKENDKRIEEEKAASSSSTSGSSNASDSSSSSSVTSSNASSTTSSTTSSSTATSSTTTSSSDEDKKYSPEEWKGLFGDEEAGYEKDEMFAEYKKQEVGKAVVLEDKENSSYVLFVKLDMLDKEAFEDYWYDYLKLQVAYNLKSDEYDGDLDTKGASFKLTEDEHATSPFPVDKIKFTVEE